MEVAGGEAEQGVQEEAPEGRRIIDSINFLYILFRAAGLAPSQGCESEALIRDLTLKGVARLAYGSGHGGQPLPGFFEHLGERRERSGRLVEVALPLLHVPEICGAFAAGAQCILERRHGRTHGLR